MADTSVKYFHSEMPGAPVMSGTAGSRIAVLDACLVNGWGLLTASSVVVAAGVATATFPTSHAFEPRTVALVAGAGAAAINGEARISTTSTNSISWPVLGVADGPVSGTITVKIAPAGWSKLAGANKAAYKSGSPSASGCWLRVDDTGARVARLRAYETMTDVDTGVGPTPTDAQQSGGLYLAASESVSAASRRWMVVATDRFVLFFSAYFVSYPYDYAPYAFGDFQSLKAGDAYNFCVVGDESDRSTVQYVGSSSSLVGYDYSVGVYIVRGYAQSGGSISGSLRKPGLRSDSGSPSLPTGPNPVNNALEICPTLIFEGSANNANRRGLIPGIYGIPHNVGGNYDSKQTVDAIVGLPGHTLIGVRYLTVNAAAGSRYAVDVTGPWS